MSIQQVRDLFSSALPMSKQTKSDNENASSVSEQNAVTQDQAFGAHDPCTHLANAHRLVKHFGGQLLYVAGRGWFTWGPPWRSDKLGALRIAQQLGRIIAKEAAELAKWVAEAADASQRKPREALMEQRFKWARQSESAQAVESSLRMAEPLLACPAGALDADPMLLGLPAGVLDLRTSKHRAYHPSDRITLVAGCNYDPNATCPTWDRFLREIMGENPDLLDYLRRLAGYSLSGRRGEHLLPILHGSGLNGKSTYIAALQAMFGEYATSAAPGLLMLRNGSDHPTGLANLQGRRFVVASETGEGGRLNEEVIKLLTGGDRISARKMRQDFFEFEPTHQFMLQTNHRPRVAGTDNGIWRRIRLIPFIATIPEDRRDPLLLTKLKAELPGLLNWAIQGWQEYQLHGFQTPEAVTVATSEYREASDPIGTFIVECCEVDEVYTATASELYQAYGIWCAEAGERARCQRDFGMRLSERGFVSTRGTRGTRRWQGLRVAVGTDWPQ